MYISYELKDLSELKVIDKETFEFCSSKISVKKGSEVSLCVAYSNEKKFIHFGLIFSNDWNVNGLTWKYCVAHLLSTKESKSLISVHFCDDLTVACDFIKNPLSSENMVHSTLSLGTSCVGFQQLSTFIPIVLQKSVSFTKSSDPNNMNCIKFVESFSSNFNINITKESLMTKVSNAIGSNHFEEMKKKFDY
jgi:hypothetical protein